MTAEKRPAVFGLAGWSGSGKTSLVIRLLPALVARGIEVSTVKHAHHNFDLDTPGKDSYRHREAGAREVLISSAKRVAVMEELRHREEPPLAELLTRLRPVDLVLIEGFKREGHDKLEVWRPSVRKPPLWPEDPRIVAVASDQETLPEGAPPRLDLDATDEIVDFIVAHCGLRVA